MVTRIGVICQRGGFKRPSLGVRRLCKEAERPGAILSYPPRIWNNFPDMAGGDSHEERGLARERLAAAIRCLILLTVFAMTRLQSAGQRGSALDAWLALGAVYVLASTFAPIPESELRRWRTMLVALDILLISGLLFLTGGMRSEYYLLYYLPILNASVRLDFRDGVAASVLSALSYALIAILQPDYAIVTNPIWRAITFGGSALLLAVFFHIASRETTRLRRSRDRFRDISEAKSELVAMMAHEFRNPMACIMGFSKMLAEDQASGEQKHEFAAAIHENCSRLNRMLSDLLDLSRMEAGGLKFQPKPVLLAPLIESAVASYRQEGRRFDVQMASDLPEAMGDGDMIAQVLHNLLSNAVKYSPAGSRVAVRAFTTNGQDGSMVQVDVQDEGPGIPTDELEHMFEKFHRGKAARGSGTAGTGLGLAITRAIVEMHGGRAWVTTREGKGTRFSFTIPIAASTAPAPQAEQAAAQTA